MCNSSGIAFATRCLSEDLVRGKTVLEVGALDVNGSVRSRVEAQGPASYTGVDICSGPGVDLVLDATDLVDQFGHDSFDVVISTELLEHVHDWRAVITNMKSVLRAGGTLLVTTRSRGFHIHAYPADYWRYEVADFEEIFRDMEILALERDPLAPGVFMFAVSGPAPQADLDGIALYSVLAARRVRTLTPRQERLYGRSLKVRLQAQRYVRRVHPRRLKKLPERLLRQ